MAEKKMCEKKSKACMEMPVKKGSASKTVMMSKGAGMKMAEKLNKKAKK